MKLLFGFSLTLILSFSALGVDVYPEGGFIDSIYPRDVQVFINKLVDSKCSESDYIFGFYEEPIVSKAGWNYYETEVVLHDYDGSGFVRVRKSSNGKIELVELTCPTWF